MVFILVTEIAPSTHDRWVLACYDAVRRLVKGFIPLIAREERIMFGSMVVAVLLLIWDRCITAFTILSGFVNSLQTTMFKVKFPYFKDSQVRTPAGYSMSSRSI